MRKQKMVLLSIFAVLFLSVSQALFSQVGMSVSPPRVYYSLNPGETGSQKVLISNVSKEHSLNISLTFGDWKYDSYGNNLMLPPDSLDNSCVDWLSLPGGTYITLEPGESREIDLTMALPAESGHKANVQTAMLFVTQMNPVDGVDAQGAAIRINVRQGIKIYRKGRAPEEKRVEIENLAFDKETHSLALTFSNAGNIWINGRVNASLFNQTTGKESDIAAIDFYTMPDDRRIMHIPFQNELEKGRYTATVMIDYGDETTIEAAELQFAYE
jgi:P pilus assembly chaperone PapD